MKSKIDKADTNLFDRYMILQLNNINDFKKFIKELKEEDVYIQKSQQYSFSEGPVGLISSTLPVVVVPVIICLLIVLYDLLNSYKKIGIEKNDGIFKV